MLDKNTNDTPPALAADMCRCENHICPERESCARYLDRFTNVNQGTPYAVMQNADGKCLYKVTRNEA